MLFVLCLVVDVDVEGGDVGGGGGVVVVVVVVVVCLSVKLLHLSVLPCVTVSATVPRLFELGVDTSKGGFSAFLDTYQVR